MGSTVNHKDGLRRTGKRMAVSVIIFIASEVWSPHSLKTSVWQNVKRQTVVESIIFYIHLPEGRAELELNDFG